MSVIYVDFRATYDASVQSLSKASDMGPKPAYGYVIEDAASYVPTVQSACGCQDCSGAFEEPKMPSMMIPVQYNNRMRRSTDEPSLGATFRRYYTERMAGHRDQFQTLRTRTLDNFAKTRQYATEQVGKVKAHISPILTKSSDFVKGFKKNFEKPVTPRERRSIDETSEPKPLMPTLKVVENEQPRCPVIQDLKENSEFRSRNAHPDVLQYMPEVSENADDSETPKRCPQCGSHLSDSMCKACSCASELTAIPPQYFRYVDGEAVPFVPGTTQSSSKRSAEPNYVFDRFGHKYEENNGNLRLIAPEFAADPQTAQPNFEAFAHIMNANAEVMHDLNPIPGGRMLPPVTDLAKDAIDLVHDLERRETKERREAKLPQEPEQEHPKRVTHKRKSHYQVIPIRHENRSGTLISKMQSNDVKADRSASESTIGQKSETENADLLHKIDQNNDKYEILTIDTRNADDSTEEFDRIMKYLHAGRM